MNVTQEYKTKIHTIEGFLFSVFSLFRINKQWKHGFLRHLRLLVHINFY